MDSNLDLESREEKAIWYIFKILDENKFNHEQVLFVLASAFSMQLANIASRFKTHSRGAKYIMDIVATFTRDTIDLSKGYRSLDE